MASAMPVLPEVESRMVLPGTRHPCRMPSWIILRAGRSFTEPPGLKPSILPKRRTPGGTPVAHALDLDQRRVADQLEHRPAPQGAFPGRGRTGGSTRLGDERCHPRSAASSDGRNDRQLVARLHRRVEVLEEPDVLAVHEDVDETPYLAGLVADALPDAGVAPVEIGQQGGHVRSLRLDGFGAARELAQRRWHSHLGHGSVPPVDCWL